MKHTHELQISFRLVSLPLLVGVPIGTILGVYMILQLSRHRAAFSSPY